MIAIIDYDAGNIKSVEKAFAYLGQKAVVTRDADIIKNADKVVLPGVGAFGDAMSRLREYGLDDAIREAVVCGKPFLGVCLGLQLLFGSSEESEGVGGLDILKGKIHRFPNDRGCKIPQIGWNSLEIRESSVLFKNIPNHSYVYFVHSYYLKAEEEGIVAASADYAAHFHAAVEKDNIFACQFHPEKSGEVGLKILANFAGL
ncbi:MAG: imidazole glycerol phosphate synthase subunit HisH [Butyrivibrio sp.]|nr:imidazole glycerol phosphate synthase subunit HisH [Butyrivibrio sp.]